MIREAIRKAALREDLSRTETEAAFAAIMVGEATPAQIGALLVALHMKGESVEELVGATLAVRGRASQVAVGRAHLVDTCGTGGDARHTFNISTTAAIVAAAAGATVAKHGNRSASGKSGSADVLEAAGLPLDAPPALAEASIESLGLGFLFAPAHHGAMRFAAGPRREIGLRTIFNLLGPMTNPAGAPNQVIGVFAERWLVPLAEAARELGSRHVMVVHGADGMDEITVTGPTEIAELRDGVVTRNRIAPEDFGLARAPLQALQVESVTESLAAMRAVLDGEPGPRRDVVLLNASAALYVAGCVKSLAEGFAAAAAAVDSGAARDRLAALIAFVRQRMAEG